MKTKQFLIDTWIWDRFPGMKLVCLAGAGLDNHAEAPAVAEHYGESQRKVRAALAGRPADSVEAFAAWRAVQPGKAFPAAHEALGLRVAGGKPLRAISPFVDSYNAVCLDFLSEGIAAPIGAWDSEVLPAIRLVETQGGERFTELGKDSPVTALPGEVGYATADGEELVTRHFVWRQSRLAAVSPGTKSFFLVSEIIEPYAEQAEHVRDRLVQVIGRFFGIQPGTAILTAPVSDWTWEE